MYKRRTGLALCLSVAGFLAWPAAQAAQPEQKWTAAMPRQNWATSDGLLQLKPLRPIAPETVADRLMIADVFSRWGIAFDEGWLDVVRSLFTEEGVLEVVDGAGMPKSKEMRRYVGREAIAQGVKNDRARQADQRRHAISNVVIEELGRDTAVAYAYGVVTAAGNGELYLGASVIYRGELVKQADGLWRLSRFVIGIDSYRRLAQ